MRQLVAEAMGTFGSAELARKALGFADIDLSCSTVERLARQTGEELNRKRQRKVIENRQRVLSIRVRTAPTAVTIEIDGGRMQTRAANTQPGVFEALSKETKVACLATLTGETYDHDPSPEPPEIFLNSRRVRHLIQAMKGQAKNGDNQEKPEKTGKKPEAKEPMGKHEKQMRFSPKKKNRTCVLSMAKSEKFGPMVAAEAQERGFFQAQRKAYVCDGMKYNWTIHQGYFSDFVPIVDFLHVICYLYAASLAVGSEDRAAWEWYVRWARACWQGRVGEVLQEMEEWQKKLGAAPEGKAKTKEEKKDPRRILQRARNYLRNNQERMDYPRYRREGLPTTSSLVESLVGEVNARVKSKQKYWSRGKNAESILQLRAAVMSEDDRLDRFFAERKGCPTQKQKTVA